MLPHSLSIKKTPHPSGVEKPRKAECSEVSSAFWCVQTGGTARPATKRSVEKVGGCLDKAKNTARLSWPQRDRPINSVLRHATPPSIQ